MSWLDDVAKTLDPGSYFGTKKGIGLGKSLFGDSGGMSAADLAKQQAHDNDRAILLADKQVNDIFNNPARQAQINQYGQAVKQRGTLDLNKVFDQNAKQLKFALARDGLTSGSADVDEHDKLNDDYAQGLLKVLANAKQAQASLEGADQASQARLLGQVQSGYGLGDSRDNALAALQTNLQGAQANIVPQTFDDLFGQWANLYQQSLINQGHQQAEKAGLGTLFNNVVPYGGQ